MIIVSILLAKYKNDLTVSKKKETIFLQYNRSFLKRQNYSDSWLKCFRLCVCSFLVSQRTNIIWSFLQAKHERYIAEWGINSEMSGAAEIVLNDVAYSILILERFEQFRESSDLNYKNVSKSEHFNTECTHQKETRNSKTDTENSLVFSRHFVTYLKK